MKSGTIIFLGAIGLLTVYSMKKRREKPNLYVKDWLPFGFNAMTVPPVGIFVTRCAASNPDLLTHELQHWDQYSKMGLLPYYINYFSQALVYGYDKMPMEKEARVGETDYCRENYTDCVRNGYSRTVYNPEFRK